MFEFSKLVLGMIHDRKIADSGTRTDETAHLPEKLMIQVGWFYNSKVPVKVDVEIADDWSGKQ